MKEVKMFMFEGCPHCQKAKEFMSEVFAETPECSKVPLVVIDERLDPVTADDYDYYYVPTFFVGDRKVHEGVPTKEAVEKVFKSALED